MKTTAPPSHDCPPWKKVLLFFKICAQWQKLDYWPLSFQNTARNHLKVATIKFTSVNLQSDCLISLSLVTLLFNAFILTAFLQYPQLSHTKAMNLFPMEPLKRVRRTATSITAKVLRIAIQTGCIVKIPRRVNIANKMELTMWVCPRRATPTF